MEPRGRPAVRVGLAGLVILVALAGVAGPLAAGATSVKSGATAEPSPGSVGVATGAAPLQEGSPFVTLQDQPDADATVTRIEVGPNGSATWTIAVRTRLESADDVESYEAFQDRFRANRSRFLSDFRDRMTGVVAAANDQHDRQMTASGFAASTTVEEAPQRWGVVRYSFRWNGFAATEDGRLAIGDVFDSGFYIEENTVLEVALPDDYSVESVEPEPDERSEGVLEWQGPATFEDQRPRVVATDGGALPTTLLALAVVLALLGVGGVVAWRRGVHRRVWPGDGTAGEPSDPEPTRNAGPLTDDDRVLRLLEREGGRTKQSTVVEELDWSKSKTSRVLSRMAEEDRISKLRIGRENVIELPDPEAEEQAER